MLRQFVQKYGRPFEQTAVATAICRILAGRCPVGSESLDFCTQLLTEATMARPLLRTPTAVVEQMGGGLCGLPLRARAPEVIRYFHRRKEGHLAHHRGGIFTPADAQEKRAA
ncbi:hypothetical protein H8B13_18610 [Hymenobacter sp. BT188]|uniref:hypothetical protein n=1 Tax=Hymenobacter sp. BT188 TaxID=2763504 RepID=UPI0016514355|nr:hypothetical protein [Hymenobacter sp. BT188]MBC6608842.1 hypothetical protein [Hymenobacter sp. BT188]